MIADAMVDYVSFSNTLEILSKRDYAYVNIINCKVWNMIIIVTI